MKNSSADLERNQAERRQGRARTPQNILISLLRLHEHLHCDAFAREGLCTQQVQPLRTPCNPTVPLFRTCGTRLLHAMTRLSRARGRHSRSSTGEKKCKKRQRYEAEFKALCHDKTVRRGFAVMETYKEPKPQPVEGEGQLF